MAMTLMTEVVNYEEKPVKENPLIFRFIKLVPIVAIVKRATPTPVDARVILA